MRQNWTHDHNLQHQHLTVQDLGQNLVASSQGQGHRPGKDKATDYKGKGKDTDPKVKGKDKATDPKVKGKDKATDPKVKGKVKA